MILTAAHAAAALKILPSLGTFAGAAIGGEKGKKIATQSAMLGTLLGVVDGLGGAFKSSSIGDVTNDPDIWSFDEGLKIGDIPGINYKKFGFNIDKIPEMKAFSTNIKDSVDWKSNTPMFSPSELGINYDDYRSWGSVFK